MNKQLLQRRGVVVAPTKPVFRKRRRLALATKCQARRRKEQHHLGSVPILSIDASGRASAE
jgi:hypothetical protein